VSNLYVGNLSYDATEEDVKEFFGQVGSVSKVTIVKDRESGRPRGFCFVEMTNGDDAISQLNGKEMLGRKLMINEARPREQRPRYDRNDRNDRG
jgi:RNA recognition motif-containing protein